MDAKVQIDPDGWEPDVPRKNEFTNELPLLNLSGSIWVLAQLPQVETRQRGSLQPFRGNSASMFDGEKSRARCPNLGRCLVGSDQALSFIAVDRMQKSGLMTLLQAVAI
jgi:hypothetical protein